MGEAGDEGQAEKGRRERRRQKAASLSGPAFHHQPLLVPCSVRVRTSGSMFSSDRSVWAPSGFCFLRLQVQFPTDVFVCGVSVLSQLLWCGF